MVSKVQPIVIACAAINCVYIHDLMHQAYLKLYLVEDDSFCVFFFSCNGAR